MAPKRARTRRKVRLRLAALGLGVLLVVGAALIVRHAGQNQLTPPAKQRRYQRCLDEAFGTTTSHQPVPYTGDLRDTRDPRTTTTLDANHRKAKACERFLH